MKLSSAFSSMIAAVCLLGASQFGAIGALTFDNPLNLNSLNVVGIATGVTGAGNGTPTTLTTVAQAILNLASGGTSTLVALGNGSVPDSHLTASSNPLNNYSGNLTAGVKFDGGTSVPAGYEYVIAKYDNQNAGYVLFHLGGQAATLPATPFNLFNGSVNGISAYMTFNAVPEPSTYVAGALLLLPLLTQVRRWKRSA